MTLPKNGAAATGARLSICIATRNRGTFIAETMDSILSQTDRGVDVVIVDGASTDETPQIMASLCARHPQVRYWREETNGGVDADYDKAVGYARGDYCWLMTDDDLLRPGAIARVLQAVDHMADVIVVDADVRTMDFAKSLGRRLPRLAAEREYPAIEAEALFRDVATHLTFIGAVIVRRAWWLSRERKRYYGSLFIHVGVIFQHPPADRALVVAEPLIMIRYGNATWTSRTFEIWAFKWPELIWSFPGYSDAAKAAVSPKEPWRRVRTLLLYRALGAYSISEYRHFIATRAGLRTRLLALAVALTPGSLTNAVVATYLAVRGGKASAELHDIVASRHSSIVARAIAQRCGL
jgi:abequosyltransferase